MGKQHYARARNQATQHRLFPTRQEFLLRWSVDMVGLHVVGYEYEVEDEETGGFHWFDIAVDLDGMGTLGLIDLVNDPSKGGVTKREREIYQEKRDLAARWKVPLLQLEGAPAAELEAKIRFWLREIGHGQLQ